MVHRINRRSATKPVDAYRAFVEEQKRLGASEIIDKSLESGFWSYFTSEKHTFISSTKEEGEAVPRKPFLENQ